MICQQCGSEYRRMEGTQRSRKDYGYCSVKCLGDSKKPCPGCGAIIKRNEGEKLHNFAKRRYCSQRCAASHVASQPKTAETRVRMSMAASTRSPEHRAKLSEARLHFLSTEEGKELLAHRQLCFQQWRQDNPTAVAEMVSKQTATRQERGVYQANSERMKAFYQTPEGQAQKERYRQMYSGKKRPPRVTEKMKKAIRKFWDSPDGLQLREEISLRYTNGQKEAPYGPFWSRQASKARQRDNHTCVCCGHTWDKTKPRLLVHHIYSRRLYGYIPGENRNFLWADHLANLITLCRACHIRVHSDTLYLPDEYQQRADMLWAEFIMR